MPELVGIKSNISRQTYDLCNIPSCVEDCPPLTVALCHLYFHCHLDSDVQFQSI